ncbi:MAG: phosphatase PAP2 family protein [Candidatus Njordarchaeia archaeon]
MSVSSSKITLNIVIIIAILLAGAFCLLIGDTNLFILINRQIANETFDIILLYVLMPFYTLIFLIPILMVTISKERTVWLSSLFSGITAYFLGDVLKEIFRRPRPYFSMPTRLVGPFYTTSYSFPSTTTALVFGIAFPILLKKPESKIGYLTVIISCLVGFSVIYTGFHYPSDVVAGVALAYVISTLFSYFKTKGSNQVGSKIDKLSLD